LPPDKTIWNNLLKETKDKINNIYKKFPKANLHLLGSLATFMFAVGIIITSKKKYCIYHFQDNELVKVMDLCKKTARSLKGEKKEKFNHIEIEEVKNNSDKLSIILYLASHNPKQDAYSFIDKNLKSNKIFIKTVSNQGNLPLDNQEKWINMVTEIYSAIDNFQNNSKTTIKSHHFFMSLPVPIALALGMAIGDYKQNHIYQYDKENQTYFEILNSKDCEDLKITF
jgi:hypothetical protein